MTFKLEAQYNFEDQAKVGLEGFLRGATLDTATFADQVLQNIKGVGAGAVAAIEAAPALATPEQDYFETVQSLAQQTLSQQNDINFIRNALIDNVGKPLETVIGGIATEAQEQRYPVTSGLSRFGGGVLNAAMPISQAPQIASGIRGITQSAIAGGALGALGTPSLEELPVSTGLGFALGGAGAAAVPAIQNAVNAARGAASRLKNFATQAYQQNTYDRFAVRRVQPQGFAPQAQASQQMPTPQQAAQKPIPKPTQPKPVNLKTETALQQDVARLKQQYGDQVLINNPELRQQLMQRYQQNKSDFNTVSKNVKETIRKQYGADIFEKNPDLEASVEKQLQESYNAGALGTRTAQPSLSAEEALALKREGAKRAFQEASSNIELQKLIEQKKLLKQQQDQLNEYFAKRNGEPMSSAEQQQLEARLAELKQAKETEIAYQKQQKDIQAEQYAQQKLAQAEQLRQQKIDEAIAKIKAEQQAIIDKDLAEKRFSSEQAKQKAIQDKKANKIAELDAKVKEAEAENKAYLEKEAERVKVLKEKHAKEVAFIKGKKNWKKETVENKLKKLKKQQEAELKTPENPNLQKIEKAKAKLEAEKQKQASEKAAELEAARMLKEQEAINKKKAESQAKQKALEDKLAELEAARMLKVEEPENPDLPRMEVLDQWIKSTESRLQAEKAKQLLAKQKELEAFGYGDKTYQELQKEQGRLAREYKAVSEELTPRLKAIAESAKSKAEKKVALAEATAPVTPTVQQRKDAQVSGFAYKDGTLSAVNIVPNEPVSRKIIKKDGKTYAVKVTADGKVAQIDTQADEATKKYMRDLEAGYTLIDDLFKVEPTRKQLKKQQYKQKLAERKAGKPATEKPSVEPATATKPVQAEPATATKPVQAEPATPAKPDEIEPPTPIKKVNKWLQGVQSAARKVFMPIQNSLDSIDQGLGNKVAKLEAELASNPKSLIEELKAETGLSKFKDDDFIKYINDLFPDKEFALNVSSRFEEATPEQKAFLTRYGAWRKNYKAELEALGAKETELVGGEAFLPRRVVFEWWASKEGSALKEFMTNAKKKNPFADNDLLMDAFNKNRKIDIVPSEMLDGYRDTGSSILIDIAQIGKQKAISSFFDNELKFGKGVSGLIGKMTAGIKDTTDRLDAQELIESLFASKPVTVDPVLRTLGNVTNKLRYGVLLGGVKTAAIQTTALPRYSSLFGVKNMLEGLLTLNRKDLPVGLSEVINDAFQSGTNQKLHAVDKVFSALTTGLFNQANKLEAKLGLSTAFSWLKNGAKSGNQDVLGYIQRRFGNEAEAVITKLKDYSGKPSKSFDADIFRYAYTAARDRGAVALSKADKTMAANSSTNQVYRELYALQTWAIKQANTVSDLTIGELNRGNRKAAIANTVTLVAVAPLMQAAFQTGIESTGDIARDAVSGKGVRLEFDTLAQDRLGENYKKNIAGFVPMVGSPYLIEQLLEGKWEEAIGNYVVKGVGTMSKLAFDTKGAVESGYTRGLRASGGDIGKGLLEAGKAAFDVDDNKSFGRIPPRVLTETYANIVDPAMRGAGSRAELNKAEELNRIYNKRPEVKEEKRIKQAQSQLEAGVSPLEIGTKTGATRYKDLTSKAGQAYRADWTGDSREVYKGYLEYIKTVPAAQQEDVFFNTYSQLNPEQKTYFYSQMQQRVSYFMLNGRIDREEALRIMRRLREDR